MGRFLYRLLLFTLLLGLIGAGVYTWGYAQYVKAGPSLIKSTVIIPRGRGLNGISEALERAGIIRDARIFRLGVRWAGIGTSLKAGEYVFPPRVSPKDAAAILSKGKTVVRRLTVAEGLTTAQVLAQLRATDGLVGGFLRTYGEGAFMPETYYFSYGDRRGDVAERMATAMKSMLSGLWAGRVPGLPFKTPREALVLASIVEKETALAAERPRIAGVFINRLKRGMRLQSDPTVSYGLTKGQGPLGRALSRADLKRLTPYNTYLINGLPPGPISNPGRAAIAAVLNPERTKDLYFVADGSGGHVFARTLKEHNRNVKKWRKIRDGQQ